MNLIVPEGREGWLVQAHRYGVMPWRRMRKLYSNLRVSLYFKMHGIRDIKSAYRHIQESDND